MNQPRRAAQPTDLAEVFIEDAVSPRRSLPRKRSLSSAAIALAPIAASVVTASVLLGSSSGLSSATAGPAAVEAVNPVTPLAIQSFPASPSSDPTITAAAKPKASVKKMYTTGNLNVRAEGDVESDLLGKVKVGSRVSATTLTEGEYRQIEFDEGYGWVLDDELATKAPPPVPEGTTMDPCPRGSRVESRLRNDTVHIYRSVCALFPEVNSYGGWRSGGLPFHKNGRALDIMLTPRAESALGWRIARYLVAHARDFNVDHIIFEQKIWTPNRRSWRKMADRGSLNANHFNHVHVAING